MKFATIAVSTAALIASAPTVFAQGTSSKTPATRCRTGAPARAAPAPRDTRLDMKCRRRDRRKEAPLPPAMHPVRQLDPIRSRSIEPGVRFGKSRPHRRLFRCVPSMIDSLEVKVFYPA